MAGSPFLPASVTRVHARRRTPHIAILITAVLSLIFLFTGDIAFVAKLTNFTLFVTFIVINAAVIVLRIHAPEAPRPFRIPGAIRGIPPIPVAGLVFSVFLLAQLTPLVIIAGLALASLGVVLTLNKAPGN
jgi:APA family basic amino acid/polyamine antiporter